MTPALQQKILRGMTAVICSCNCLQENCSEKWKNYANFKNNCSKILENCTKIEDNFTVQKYDKCERSSKQASGMLSSCTNLTLEWLLVCRKSEVAFSLHSFNSGMAFSLHSFNSGMAFNCRKSGMAFSLHSFNSGMAFSLQKVRSGL